MLEQAVLREIERLQRAGSPFCLATIVDGRGSIPQIVGVVSQLLKLRRSANA